MSPTCRKPSFSLVELVIVIVIIGIIAAIAVPRISRGARGAAGAAVRADLTMLRKAIEWYAAEHGGAYPTRPDSKFVDQLTTYSDDQGNTNPTKTPPYIFGPYLVSIPVLKIGEGAGNGKGRNRVDESAVTSTAWIYDDTTGSISANSGTAADESGTLFSDY